MINGSRNKGDWGEFYALLRLLAMRKLYSADEDLTMIPSYYFPILKVLRDEKRADGSTSHLEYVLSTQDDAENVAIYVDGVLMKTLSSEDFKREADLLQTEIPAMCGRQFTIPHGEAFLNEIYLERLAAPSTEVTDIRMEVHDPDTGRTQEPGFSIKSYLGGAPTLLNASEATNFVYEVHGLTRVQMDEVNAIHSKNKIIDRIAKIAAFGGTLEYRRTANATFSSNLMMVDSLMDRILSEMLLIYYQTNTCDCNDVISQIETMNPLKYPRAGLYVHKFKKFLCAKALGMDPATPWCGEDEANGGYIAVKSDGDVLAYHLYNRDKFEQYLLDNTHFERGSTSRHQYATIYEECGNMYINLNLQIRFYDNH